MKKTATSTTFSCWIKFSNNKLLFRNYLLTLLTQSVSEQETTSIQSVTVLKVGQQQNKVSLTIDTITLPGLEMEVVHVIIYIETVR